MCVDICKVHVSQAFCRHLDEAQMPPPCKLLCCRSRTRARALADQSAATSRPTDRLRACVAWLLTYIASAAAHAAPCGLPAHTHKMCGP